MSLLDLLPGGETQSIAAAEVISADEIMYSFGSGLNSLADPGKDSLELNCVESLKEYLRGGELTAEEITRAQYMQLMEYRSLYLNYGYDLPWADFCGIIGAEGAALPIGSIREWGFSSGSPESLFVYDGEEDRCYRLLSHGSTELFDMILSSLSAAPMGDLYYRSNLYFGGDRWTLIPVSYSSALQPQPCRADLENADAEEIREFAEPFFGRDFGFVRRVEESRGTVVYMYGYGQKTLSFSKDGGVEYREEQTGDASGRQDFTRDLTAALHFLSHYGGWTEEIGERFGLRLREAEKITDNRQNGYRFLFGLELEGEALYGSGEQLLTAEVYGGQVTYFYRSLPAFTSEIRTGTAKEAAAPVQLLTKVYEEIDRVLVEKGAYEGLSPEMTGIDAAFDRVVARLDQVKAGWLFDRRDGWEQLLPVWIFEAGGMDFYYDLYSGEARGSADHRE